MEVELDLEVENLKMKYGTQTVLHGLDLKVSRGERLGIIGESGSGKSTLLRCLAGIEKGYTADKMQVSRPHLIQFIFQDPVEALSPRYRVCDALQEGAAINGEKYSDQQLKIALEQVNLSEDYLDRFPRELSGGQRQRVCIARALLRNPQLLFCDEPASALDLSTGISVLNLLKSLSIHQRMGLILVSHDISQVEFICDRVLVLYRGTLVEEGSVQTVLRRPVHPYTQSLIASRPTPKWLRTEMTRE